MLPLLLLLFPLPLPLPLCEDPGPSGEWVFLEHQSMKMAYSLEGRYLHVPQLRHLTFLAAIPDFRGELHVPPRPPLPSVSM